MTQMMVVVSGRREDLSIYASQDIEREINALRDNLKDENIRDINNHAYSYALGAIYNDIIEDWIFNILIISTLL